jgi:ubiquinone/menaquinone biosynthesis C-methylase UbiE
MMTYSKTSGQQRIYKMNKCTYNEKQFPVGKGICLDLGAGTGRMKKFIRKHGYVWIGLDFEKNPNLIIIADAHQLPFKSAAFDLVNMNAVLEHFHHPKKVMDEVYRVLRKSGILYGWVAFLEPYHGSFFHFTFRGLEIILNDCGLVDISIWAGPHVMNSIFQHTLPFFPQNVRQKLAKFLGDLYSKIGLRYMHFTKGTIDGIHCEALSTKDLLFKFAEGYSFYAKK